jgi:hypothetical protein
MYTLKEAYAVVGKPTTGNTKMTDTLCFNTTPEKCATGRQLRKKKGTPCFYCYSWRLINFRKNVGESYRRNYELLLSALNEYGVNWVAKIMEFIITKKKRKRVRIKDGGDVVSMEEFYMWLMVAIACKNNIFWMPTKEYKWVREFFRRAGHIPKNIIFRVSMPMVNQPPSGEFKYTSVVYSLAKYDAVKETRKLKKCPAKYQGNQCLDCPHCYDPKVETVVYPL